MAYVGRNIPIEAIRFATFNQAIDELRHAQIEIKHYAHMSKEIDGLHNFANTSQNLWFNTVSKSFFDDAMTAGPFEALNSDFILIRVCVYEYSFLTVCFICRCSG